MAINFSFVIIKLYQQDFCNQFVVISKSIVRNVFPIECKSQRTTLMKVDERKNKKAKVSCSNLNASMEIQSQRPTNWERREILIIIKV